jgi:hypothetical protein
MDPLTQCFVTLDTTGFAAALNARLQQNGFLHPRFDDGLLVIDEFDFYIHALQQRIPADDAYLLHALECEREYHKYTYQGFEPLTCELQQKIISQGYIDEFGNHSIIAAVQTKNVKLVELATRLYPDLVNVPGKFADRALDHACILIEDEIVEVLLNAGANPDLQSAFNGLPIDWLTISSKIHPEKTGAAATIVSYL